MTTSKNQPNEMKPTPFKQPRGYLRSPLDLLKLNGRMFYYMVRVPWFKKSAQISRSYSEKLMLAVTGVSSCNYCSYLHTKTALASGVNIEEINRALKGELDNFTPDEAPGLAYAQHWCEQRSYPDNEVRNNVVKHYGEDKVRRMEASMMMVYFGNQCSNTLEAYHLDLVTEGKFCFILTLIPTAPIAWMIKTIGEFRHS